MPLGPTKAVAPVGGRVDAWPDGYGLRVPSAEGEPLAWFGGVLATGLVDLSDDPAALDGSGWWAVVMTYEGRLVCARFRDVRPGPLPDPAARWCGTPGCSR